jgi:hypothetical protein
MGAPLNLVLNRARRNPATSHFKSSHYGVKPGQYQIFGLSGFGGNSRGPIFLVWGMKSDLIEQFYTDAEVGIGSVSQDGRSPPAPPSECPMATSSAAILHGWRLSSVMYAYA